MVGSVKQGFMYAIRRRARRFEHERTARQSTFKFVVTIESDGVDGGYVASVDGMPGCLSQGETVDEAIENVMEALNEIFIDTLSEQVDSEKTSIQYDSKTTKSFRVAVGC